jgi:hypothetical protein
VSKRHTTSRRRSYGRRQHELQERLDRRQDRRTERSGRLGHPGGLDALSYEGHAADAPYGYAD